MNEDNDDKQNEDIEIEEIVDINEARSQKDDSLRQELEKAKNDFLYLRAEFDNYKKRALKERSDYIRFAGEQAFVAILDVLDNFDRALATQVTTENIDSFKKGVQLIADNFQSVLKKFGVEEVRTEGVMFDPNQHEALGSEETDAVQPGYVSKAFRKTYKMHDRIIRPGQVIVAKARSEKEES